MQLILQYENFSYPTKDDFVCVCIHFIVLLLSVHFNDNLFLKKSIRF